MIIRWLIAFLLGFALMGTYLSLKQAFSSDGFVQMIERREGMSPGQTKVLPECSCTIRYLGTTVHGRNYDVHIRRLD